MHRFILIVVLLAMTSAASPAEEDRLADRVVAAVDQTLVTARDVDFFSQEAMLTRREFTGLTLAEARRRAAKLVVEEILLAEWAQTVVEPVTPEALRARLEQRYARLADLVGGREQFDDFLAIQSIDRTDFHRWMEHRSERLLLIESALAAYTEIGAEDILEGAARGAVAFQLALIKIPGLAEPEEAYRTAVAIRHEIASGLPFGEAMILHRRLSEGRISAQALGWVEREELDPVIREAVEPLRRGETSKPIPFEQDWLLVSLEDWRSARQQAYAEALEAEEKRRLADQRAIRSIRYADEFRPPDVAP